MSAASSRKRCWICTVGVLMLIAGGCTSWKPVVTPSASAPGTDTLAKYRITTADGRVWRFADVYFRNDSLIGRQLSEGLPYVPGLPVGKINFVEVETFNVAGSVFLAASLIAVVAAVVGSDMDRPTPPPSTKPIVSCPLIYSWDGSEYRLDSGTFGGAITPGLARTDMDNLIHARSFGGVLRFRMTAEAPETEHVDAITVLAVDHPAGTTVAPDARANTTYHVVGDLRGPIAARDRMRPDVLPPLVAADGHVWEPRLDGRDPANPAHLRDGIELTFARPATDALQLVIDGQNTAWAAQLMSEMVAAHGRLTAAWYDPATTARASAPMLRTQREQGFLTVSIWDGEAWQSAGQVWEAGPEVAKRQVLPIDLRGIPGTTVRVRLESAPAMWSIDYVGLGPQLSLPVTAQALRTTAVASARFADGLARLASADGVMLDMEMGDTVALTVADASPVARGMTRSYLLRSSGWYQVHGRDADAPIAATMAGLAQPNGSARLAIVRLNEALAMIAANAQHVGQH